MADVRALDLLRRLPAPVRDALGDPAGLAAALQGWYGAPSRCYHGLDHLAALIEIHATWCAEGCPEVIAAPPAAWTMAVLLHDAVYEPGRGDNEERSARLAAPLLAAQGLAEHTPAVERLIRLSARHGSLDPSEVEPWEALWLDADMAVLGADAATYARYAAGIAAEFADVATPEQWRVGRAAWIRGLLARPRLFLHPLVEERLGEQARWNLAHELAALLGAP